MEELYMDFIDDGPKKKKSDEFWDEYQEDFEEFESKDDDFYNDGDWEEVDDTM